MRYGYMRVSTQDQNLTLQKDALEGAECDVIYSDKISGKKTTRDGLDDLLAVLTEGDELVVWKLDRLGRSTVHLITLIDELASQGVVFKSLTENIDTGSALGKMHLGLLSVFAEYERNLISERTRAGMAAAKAAGQVFGVKPQSEYTSDKIKKLYHKYKNFDRVAEVAGVSKSTAWRAVNGKAGR